MTSSGHSRHDRLLSGNFSAFTLQQIYDSKHYERLKFMLCLLNVIVITYISNSFLSNNIKLLFVTYPTFYWVHFYKLSYKLFYKL